MEYLEYKKVGRKIAQEKVLQINFFPPPQRERKRKCFLVINYSNLLLLRIKNLFLNPKNFLNKRIKISSIQNSLVLTWF